MTAQASLVRGDQRSKSRQAAVVSGVIADRASRLLFLNRVQVLVGAQQERLSDDNG